MNLKQFSIYDSKAELFIQPFYSQSTGTAIRSFETACNEEGHDFNKYAADFTLFELGDFDQHSGISCTLETPLNLGLAITFIREPKAPVEAPALVFGHQVNSEAI